jgi:hypothetical protein
MFYRVRQGAEFGLSHRVWLNLSIISAVVITVPFFYWDSIDNFLDNYVYRDHWDSTGGPVRVAMNVLPALLLLVKWLVDRNKDKKEEIHGLWILMSFVAIAMVLLIPVSSTVADRMSLYLIALQGVVFSQVPYWTQSPIYHGALKAGIIGAYGLVLFVWFSYADHAYDWLPYENIFLR